MAKCEDLELQCRTVPEGSENAVKRAGNRYPKGIEGENDNSQFINQIGFSGNQSKLVALYENSVFAGGHLDYRLFRPLWNSRTRKFYISVPAISTNTNGAVDEIDPKSMMVTRVFAIYTPAAPLVWPCFPNSVR